MPSDFLLPRFTRTEEIRAALARSPVVSLLGPRQSGKTELVRPFAEKPTNYFDLYKLVDRARLEDSDYRVLDGLEGVVVIDEVQRDPQLFEKLRILADRPEHRTRFLIAGSASPSIVRGVSESLAGRAALLQMTGFTADETGWDQWPDLWLRGSFPPAFLNSDTHSFTWRLDYIQQFLERDIPALAETRMSAQQLRRFLLLLAHSHGQHWNHSQAAQTLGVNYKTVQRHVDLFQGAFLVRELPPFDANIRKRLRKHPKLYLRDSGLLHALLQLRDHSHLEAHPRFGASWEGFCIEQIVHLTRTRDEECFAWTVQGNAEVDLILTKPKGTFGFEFKAGDAPRRTPSMTTALSELSLTKLFVVYPSTTDYALGDRLEVVGFPNLARVVAEIT
jgi:hypothetical protein